MVYIDFEFCKPSEKDMGLICCSLKHGKLPVENYWLLDGTDTEDLKERLCFLENETFVAYNIEMAEARCFYALGLDPRSFKWRDLMLEWKWLRNGDDRYTYGDVISADGSSVSWSMRPSIKLVKRMSDEERKEAEERNAEECEWEGKFRHCKVTNQAAGLGLLDCEYFFGVIGAGEVLADKETKHEIRDVLIVGNRDNPAALQERKGDIMTYCASDIHLLRELEKEITSAMNKVANEDHLFILDGEVLTTPLTKIKSVQEVQEMMGAWAARLATYAMRGIPLDMTKYVAVKEAVPQLLVDAQMEWNRTHPDNPIYRVGAPKMLLDRAVKMKKKSPYVNFEVTKDATLIYDMIDRYCKMTKIDWRRTKTGYATDSDYLKEMDDGALIHEFRKHNDSLTSLKSMATKDDGSVKMDASVGSDGKQRPYFCPFGTKTGRNATKASTFLFLGPKWMRLLVNPKDGTYVCDLDAHSQEVAIAAALYNDENKREVYRSPDVYMKYAQLAGAYPADKPVLTEEERNNAPWWKEEGWGKVRKIYKGGVLGLQFGMAGESLRRRVLLSLPEEERAQIDDDWGNRFVDEYHRLFNSEFECTSELKHKYAGREGGVVLADGWRIGPDDPNLLSIGNFPVQGTGAVILRHACALMDEAGIKLYATLHDAVSITGKVKNLEHDVEVARECFRQAAEDVLGEDLMIIGSPEIIKNGDNWIHDDSVPETWNRMAEKHFPQYVIKK